MVSNPLVVSEIHCVVGVSRRNDVEDGDNECEAEKDENQLNGGFHDLATTLNLHLASLAQRRHTGGAG